MDELAGLIESVSTLADRIREAMGAMSPAELARKAEVTSGAVSQWLDGTIKSLKGQTGAKLEAATGYRANWILTGQGPKRVFESNLEQLFQTYASSRGIGLRRLSPENTKGIPEWLLRAFGPDRKYVPDFVLSTGDRTIFVELKPANLMSSTFMLPVYQGIAKEHPDEFAVCLVDPSHPYEDIDAFLQHHGLAGEAPAFARNLDLSSALPSQFRVEERGPSYGMQPILAWQYEDELPPGEFVMVPRLDISLSAGHGGGSSQVDIQFNESQPQAFRAEWVRQQHLKPRKLAAMTASGDSMEPTIHDGDSLLIDTSQVDPQDGRVYALWYDGGERVKRLFRLPGAGLRIESDNARYRAIELGPEYTGHVRIIGRVVHRSGTGGL